MTVAPETPVVALRHGRDLVSPELFARLADFCAEEYGHERSMAERIMSEAITLCYVMGSTNAGDVMAPSKAVDPGWHAFMLHTEDYAKWCTENFGYFLHHRPNSKVRTQGLMVDVVGRIRAEGFEADERLWGTAAECNAPACCGDGPCC
ncbi:glycine-rich domain-containing protein [Streptomyces sp. NPDC093060]|uniref:glycine-rich domain-containing protein n=1 Tax=Streptomyces sp. NPDC093060 TaxID=3366019 RepID=UPI00381392C2